MFIAACGLKSDCEWAEWQVNYRKIGSEDPPKSNDERGKVSKVDKLRKWASQEKNYEKIQAAKEG